MSKTLLSNEIQHFKELFVSWKNGYDETVGQVGYIQVFNIGACFEPYHIYQSLHSSRIWHKVNF